MAEKIKDPSDEIDYRLGGETWDSFVLKYMATMPYVFRILNALNGTDDTGISLPTPVGAGAIVRRNVDNSVTGNITGNSATSDKLKTARNITLKGDAQGTVSFDGSQNVSIDVHDVTGNADFIRNKAVDIANLQDGTILVFRTENQKFMLESKGTIGAGRTLTIKDGNEVLGTFSGDVETAIDIAPSLRDLRAVVANGNVATATKLQTARSINGTAFDGSTNIITARWGAARNVYIKDATSTNTSAAVSVDGSGNVNLLLPATIKANLNGNATGSSGSCTGNAATATKLQTTRSINGTNFDGSAAITTAKWGTARNISIKDSSSTNTGTAVSVDGSGNITLILPAAIKANITGNVTGNATTATKLATARTINIQDSSATNTGTGASFDGSGNATIKLPATIKADVTGNAATATKINGKTIAYVESFNSSSGELRLRSL